MDEEYRFSAPGRVEIGGNRTDHQHGRVLAAAINLESKAIVRRNCEGKIRVISEGYDPVEIDVWDLGVHEEEKNTTAALIRGVASAFTECGCKLCGFGGGGKAPPTLPPSRRENPATTPPRSA